MAASTMKYLTVKSLQHFYGRVNQVMDCLEEIDPNVEWAGLARREVAAVLAQYISCCMRRGGMHPRPLLRVLMPASRKLRSLRVLPVTSLSQASQQAGLPALHRCRRRQILTTPMLSNSPPPPPTLYLNFRKQGLQATFSECYCIIFVF